MSQTLLRAFIPSGKPLSDGSFLRRNDVPQHFSCHGDFLFLTVAGQRWKLLANVGHVSAGDRQEIINGDGRKQTRTFDSDGTVLDFVVPPELLSIVRRVVTLRRSVGVALTFKALPFIGVDSAMTPSEELTGAALTTGPDVDRAARFELIDL